MSHSIAEAAAATSLTPDTLRYYERDGLMLRPVARTATGHPQWLRPLSRAKSSELVVQRQAMCAIVVDCDCTLAGDPFELTGA